MNVIRRRGWEIPESQVTPEHVFFNRRTFLAGAASIAAMSPQLASAQRVADVPDPTADLYPAKANTEICGRPAADRREDRDHLQQFL